LSKSISGSEDRNCIAYAHQTST